MVKFSSLSNINDDVLFEAFNDAFRDYEMQLNKKELNAMLVRRGFVPELSFGAFADNKLVAFTFNGIGYFEGKKTAYDTGTGTRKEYRGKGLATNIFNYSIPYLTAAGISQYLLEVIQNNSKALSVYSKLGFEVSREFNYSVEKKENVRLRKRKLPAEIKIRECDLARVINARAFWDFHPSWQNSFDAISRNPVDFRISGAFKNEQLTGYCIFEVNSGDITQIAVDPEHRRTGIGTSLLQSVLKFNLHGSVKAINTETSSESIAGFLQSISLPPSGKQFEMIKKL